MDTGYTMIEHLETVIGLGFETPALLAVTVGVLVTAYLLLSERPKGAPPGPRGLPFVGNMFLFRRWRRDKKRFHVQLLELSKKYGDVYYMSSWGQGTVFFNGYDVIHEAFVKNADLTSSRPSWLKIQKVSLKEGRGVIWQNGHDWKITRKFTLQTLRDFGVGKTSLEEKIVREIDAATEFLLKTQGKPTDPKIMFAKTVHNIIHGIVFNERFDFEHATLKEMVDAMATMFKQGDQSFDGNIPDWVQKLLYPEVLEVILEKRKKMVWVKAHINEQIAAHEKTYNGGNIRDFVDLYIQSRKEDQGNLLFNKGNMFRVIMDLFIAGSETTYSTLTWCILFLQEYPDVQTKCREAIRNVCGRRGVSWADKDALSYVQAVIQESQRLGCPASFTIPHAAEEDISLLGYRIPRHTILNGNLYAVNRDPRHWVSPDQFDPERFLENGQLKKNPAFVVFGTGPRICLGEPLAKMEAFLVLANLIQRFTFEKEDPSVRQSFEEEEGRVILTPMPFNTRAFPCVADVTHP